MNLLLWGLLLALLVLRRFRYLIVLFILAQVVSLLAENVVAAVAQRPRPFGVEIREGWGGWAMPSLQITYFTASLVVVLYTLVPEGRWRNTGKWVAAGLVALDCPGPDCAGRRCPHRCPGRCGHRGDDPTGDLPAGRPQRGLPDHLPAGPQRPPGRRRGPRGGDPAWTA